MATATDTYRLAARVPADLADRARHAAEAQDRTLSNFTRRALEREVAAVSGVGSPIPREAVEGMSSRDLAVLAEGARLLARDPSLSQADRDGLERTAALMGERRRYLADFRNMGNGTTRPSRNPLVAAAETLEALSEEQLDEVRSLYAAHAGDLGQTGPARQFAAAMVHIVDCIRSDGLAPFDDLVKAGSLLRAVRADNDNDVEENDGE